MKNAVRTYWEAKACGEVYATSLALVDIFASVNAARYALEPYIASFAEFGSGVGKDVLKIGVGMGCDHVRWAHSKPRSLIGIDLTNRAVELTRQRLALSSLDSDVRVVVKALFRAGLRRLRKSGNSE